MEKAPCGAFSFIMNAMVSVLRNKRLQTALAIILVIAVLFGIGFLLQDVFTELGASLDSYASAHPVLGPLFFILLAAASVMLGPFTSAPIVPLAIFLWGPLPTLGYLLSGWVFGNAVAYAIGFYLGHPVVRRVVPKAKLDRWIRFVSEEADITLLFFFRLVSPSEMGYVFGILKYDFWKYAALSVFSEIPVALALVYAGDAFVSNNWWGFAVFGIVWLFAMLVALHALQKSSAKRAQG